MPTVYLALLIPLIVTGIFYYFKRHEFVWWEFFVPIASVLVAIIISKAIIDHSAVQFEEYWGSSVTAVFEEEPYNYWQHQICSYTTTSGKITTTHYYDCSHQVNVGPSWWAKTDLNENFAVQEKRYDELALQFKTSKTVVDSHKNHSPRDKASNSRGTKFEGKRVGETSYVYQTTWNGDDNTRKAYVSKHRYENKIKASDLTIFNIKVVKEKLADSLKLFRYPSYEGGGLFSYTKGLEYPTILGDSTVSKETQEKFKRLNGKFGVSNQLRLWVLVFENKPFTTAKYQENYWVKGNMNELVLCIGKRGNKIEWSHAFSWATSDVLTTEIKDKVIQLYTYRDSTIKRNLPPAIPVKKIAGKAGKDLPKVLPLPQKALGDTIIKIKSDFPMLTEKTWDELYTYLNQNLNKFQRRSFKEFDYLTVEPSVGAVIFIYLLALAISIGMNIWVTTNDIYE
jgi:hypothetical protein